MPNRSNPGQIKLMLKRTNRSVKPTNPIMITSLKNFLPSIGMRWKLSFRITLSSLDAVFLILCWKCLFKLVGFIISRRACQVRTAITRRCMNTGVQIDKNVKTLSNIMHNEKPGSGQPADWGKKAPEASGHVCFLRTLRRV